MEWSHAGRVGRRIGWRRRAHQSCGAFRGLSLPRAQSPATDGFADRFDAGSRRSGLPLHAAAQNLAQRQHGDVYRHTYGPAWDESGEIGATPEARDAFSVDIATAWEREFNTANAPRTRKVALRMAMVLGNGGNSVFPVLCRLARFGLGGRMANGQQFVSWIHASDLCRALDWILEHEEISGPVNLAAPNPVPNREMMAAVRELCGVPFGLPAAAWMLEIGAFFLRTETELMIKSRRVVPGRLRASGFQFRFPKMRAAMADLLARGPD